MKIIPKIIQYLENKEIIKTLHVKIYGPLPKPYSVENQGLKCYQARKNEWIKDLVQKVKKEQQGEPQESKREEIIKWKMKLINCKIVK